MDDLGDKISNVFGEKEISEETKNKKIHEILKNLPNKVQIILKRKI